MEVETTIPRSSRGFTLIELITTVAVAAVCLAVLVPAWSGMVERSHITTVTNQLLTQLRYARNEAVTRNRAVSLCPSDDASSCSGDFRGWHKGYIVFEDTDGNRRRSPGETLLRVQGPQSIGLRLHTSAGRPAVRFRGDGSAWSTNTTFRICLGKDAGRYRTVVLYGTGRARVDRRAPGNRSVSCS